MSMPPGSSQMADKEKQGTKQQPDPGKKKRDEEKARKKMVLARQAIHG
jgi:hypothetical protein